MSIVISKGAINANSTAVAPRCERRKRQSCRWQRLRCAENTRSMSEPPFAGSARAKPAAFWLTGIRFGNLHGRPRVLLKMCL